MKGLNKFETKTLCFMTALNNAYRDEEQREDVGKLTLTEDELTEDFTAMLFAMKLFYGRISSDEQDIIGFTHILNRLAIQHVMEQGGNE